MPDLILGAFGDGKLQKAIDALGDFGTEKHSWRTDLRASIAVRACDSCGISWLQLRVERRSISSWTEISGLARSQFTREPLSLAPITRRGCRARCHPKTSMWCAVPTGGMHAIEPGTCLRELFVPALGCPDAPRFPSSVLPEIAHTLAPAGAHRDGRGSSHTDR